MSNSAQTAYEIGGMTTEEFRGDIVVKTMSFPVSFTVAERLALNLEMYQAALQQEPLPTPAVSDIAVVQDEVGYRVRHQMQVIQGPNLCSLVGGDRSLAVRDLLEKISCMTVFRSGLLVTPIDAKATNMHVDDTHGVTLVDLFPPMARHANGAFPLENIPQGNSALRRKIVPYINGTRDGAMIRVLSTVLSDGARPLRQFKQLAQPTQDWCYDVLPPDLPARSRDKIHQSISHRFFGQWLLATSSGAAHQMRNKIGLPRYMD